MLRDVGQNKNQKASSVGQTKKLTNESVTAINVLLGNKMTPLSTAV